MFGLILWPLFLMSVIMLNDNPNVYGWVALFRETAYYLTLLYFPLVCVMLWLDRKKVRERHSIKYRLKIWLCPMANIALVAVALVFVFQLNKH